MAHSPGMRTYSFVNFDGFKRVPLGAPWALPPPDLFSISAAIPDLAAVLQSTLLAYAAAHRNGARGRSSDGRRNLSHPKTDIKPIIETSMLPPFEFELGSHACLLDGFAVGFGIGKFHTPGCRRFSYLGEFWDFYVWPWTSINNKVEDPGRGRSPMTVSMKAASGCFEDLLRSSRVEVALRRTASRWS